MKTKLESMLELRVRKLGNSLIMTIPAEIAKMYGIVEGSAFEVLPDKEKLILHSKKKDNNIK